MDRITSVLSSNNKRLYLNIFRSASSQGKDMYKKVTLLSGQNKKIKHHI